MLMVNEATTTLTLKITAVPKPGHVAKRTSLKCKSIKDRKLGHATQIRSCRHNTLQSIFYFFNDRRKKNIHIELFLHYSTVYGLIKK